MKKYPILIGIAVILLGWVFDFLFWGHRVGINYSLYLSLCLVAGLTLLLINGHKPALKSLWLILPFVFFAIITFTRREPLTLILAYLFTLLSLGVLAVTYLGGRWAHYGLLDYGKKFILLVGGMLVKPYRFLEEARPELTAAGEKIQGWPLKRILRGVLIAIPIVAFFAILLTSADMVFNQKLTNVLVSFNITNLPEYFIRLVIILILAYALLGVYLHAATESKDENLLAEGKPVLKRFLHFTEATIVLGSVAALFLAFVIIQFQYFFGGEVNIGIEGYTYSEYARSGFNELISVAFFCLVMVLGLSAVTRRESEWQKRIYSGLCVILLALVLVILVSAYQRLGLAIDWHGFSRLRLYPRVFLIWVGILFIAVIVLEIIRQERFFVTAALLACLGFAISLSVINVDASIVRHNVYRTLEGKHFNVNHLTTLSTDAVPALAEAFMDRSVPEAIHEGVGAALVCFLNMDGVHNDPNFDWRSFNYSKWAAMKALDRVDEYLQKYHYYDDYWPIQVETPQQDIYECAFGEY